MKVKINKKVVIEVLEGSIVEVSEKQYKFIKDYCELMVEESVKEQPKEDPKQEIKEQPKKKKTTKK